jgi:hypothetical protein
LSERTNQRYVTPWMRWVLAPQPKPSDVALAVKGRLVIFETRVSRLHLRDKRVAPVHWDWQSVRAVNL